MGAARGAGGTMPIATVADAPARNERRGTPAVFDTDISDETTGWHRPHDVAHHRCSRIK